MITLTTVDGPSSDLIVQLIIIVVLILVNAFFAASELAILSANPYKIDALVEKQNKKAILVKKLKEDETKFLSTIQVGITLAGFFSSATAAVSLSEGMAVKFLEWGVPFGDTIALVIVTLILSYFTLVFGELFPKRIALRKPEAIAMAFAGPINVIRIAFKPIVFLLSGSCNLLVKIFGLKPNDDDKVTEDEIKALVSSGVEDGTIDEDEQDLINAVFTFGDISARDAMTPRIKVFMIDINDSLIRIKRLIKENKFTRIPVYEGDKDHVIGILNMKDLIISLKASFTYQELREVLHKPLFINENMKADILFKEMQANKVQSAIVLDETGSVSGFVTMEDLIEEVMGNIDDEYDETIELIKELDYNTYLVQGSIPLQDLDRELSTNLKKYTDEFTSLAGFVTDKFEDLPEPGEELDLPSDEMKIKVIEVEDNTVKTVEIYLYDNE